MRRTRVARIGGGNDIGTLWTLRRLHHEARCALIESLGKWELRVVIDGGIVLSEPCRRGAEAFALGELWKRRMLDDGWHVRARASPQHIAWRAE